MASTVKGFVVALEGEISREQAEAVKLALLQIRGVVAVELSEATCEDWMIRNMVRAQLTKKLWEVLYPTGP